MPGGSEQPKDDASRVSAEDFAALVHETIPFTRAMPITVESMSQGACRLRLAYRDEQLRAGGTINGGVMMTLADAALYGAVLSRIGMQPLAVTADLSIHFLRKPPRADLVADARILKLGRRLAVGTIALVSDDEGQVVAHATGSYALP